MAVCEIMTTCIFFNDQMESMPGSADFFKKKYCQGDNSECARHIVFKKLGRPNVPRDLFPNQIERAKKIIEIAGDKD